MIFCWQTGHSPCCSIVPIHGWVGNRTSFECCHLLCLLNRFVKLSRQQRPDGSLPAFAWDHMAHRLIPMIAITATRSLFPSSSACYPINSLYSSSPPGGESNRFTTFRLLTRFDSLGLTYPPVGLLSACRYEGNPTPIQSLFSPSLSASFGLLALEDVYRSFTSVAHAIVS